MEKTIGVVHGGTGYERDKSLHYGKHVAKILHNLGMNVLEMHLHPNGSWTIDGQVGDIEHALKKTSKVWNCLVGVDGEKAIVEKLCDKCKVKVVGHNILHTELAQNKKNMKYAISGHKVKVPFGKIISPKEYSQEKLMEIFSTVPMPAIVKPNYGSGLFGLVPVETFPELKQAADFLIGQGQDVLVERMLKGTPVSCFVFEHNNLLHTHIKVYGDRELTRDEQLQIRNEALYIHNIMAFDHHAEYDFMLAPRGIYFLEVNTHPSLTHGYIGDVFRKGVVNLPDYIGSRVK